ncbi:hypothetical protein HY380_02290 [Candidatus Saccharibacteria bacterium]|nr:hypothetical protein [Candidatus Saccharibacteria bacterium]
MRHLQKSFRIWRDHAIAQSLWRQRYSLLKVEKLSKGWLRVIFYEGVSTEVHYRRTRTGRVQLYRMRSSAWFGQWRTEITPEQLMKRFKRIEEQIKKAA